MNREVHVRFDGSGRGKIPPATLHGKADNQGKHGAAFHEQIAALETVPAPFGRVTAILNARDSTEVRSMNCGRPMFALTSARDPNHQSSSTPVGMGTHV